METFKRLCIRDYKVIDGDKEFTVKRGKEYLTSDINAASVLLGIKPKKDCVIVFAKYWLTVPINYFVD